MGSSILSSFIMFTVCFLLSLVATSLAGVPSCTTVYDEKCWDEPRQECKDVQKPFTTTYYEKECGTKQVPRVDHVPEMKCKDVPEEKCHTRYEKKCSTRYEQECNTEHEKKCHYEPEQVCNTVTETKIDYVTKQKCGLET